MTSLPPRASKDAVTEPPLISRNTVVILLSYQTGMILGHGIPTSLASWIYLGVAVAVICYLSYALLRLEGHKKRESQKHHRTARQVDRRIRTHIIDKPVNGQKAPLQPRLRTNADFVPVVSDWV